ncbi:hypothetical protein NPIL_313191, partial [Nephila pilipes]
MRCHIVLLESSKLSESTQTVTGYHANYTRPYKGLYSPLLTCEVHGFMGSSLHPYKSINSIQMKTPFVKPD